MHPITAVSVGNSFILKYFLHGDVWIGEGGCVLGDARAQQQGREAARGDTQRAMNSPKWGENVRTARAWPGPGRKPTSVTALPSNAQSREQQSTLEPPLSPPVSLLFGDLPLNCMTACAPVQWQQAEAHHLSFSSNHNVGRVCPSARNRSSLEIEHM